MEGGRKPSPPTTPPTITSITHAAFLSQGLSPSLTHPSLGLAPAGSSCPMCRAQGMSPLCLTAPTPHRQNTALTIEMPLSYANVRTCGPPFVGIDVPWVHVPIGVLNTACTYRCN